MVDRKGEMQGERREQSGTGLLMGVFLISEQAGLCGRDDQIWVTNRV